MREGSRTLETESSGKSPPFMLDLQCDAQHARARPPIRIKARVRQVLQSYGNKVLSKSQDERVCPSGASRRLSSSRSSLLSRSRAESLDSRARPLSRAPVVTERDDVRGRRALPG